MRYTGQVIKKRVGVGSKSEHDAVLLVTDAGEYQLRRLGGNPFRDPELDTLVGRTIHAEGQLHGHILIMSKWEMGPVV